VVGRSNPAKERIVLLVERHPIAARHLGACLNQIPGLRVTLTELPLSPRSLLSKPSVVVIDVEGPPFAQVRFFRAVTTWLGDVPILVIGNRLSDDELCRLIFHGVRGFVPYEEVEGEICPAVEAVCRGHMWYSPRVLERYAMLSSSLQKQEGEGRDGLSPRETEVVGLLHRRLSDKEIGSVLGISERTVRFHLHNVFEKLGVRDRYSAMELTREGALELGVRGLVHHTHAAELL